MSENKETTFYSQYVYICVSTSDFCFSFSFYIYKNVYNMAVNRKRVLVKGLVSQKRIPEIDLLRGIPIFLVVLFHFCWIFPNVLFSFSNCYEMLETHPNLADFVLFLNQDILAGDGVIHTYLVPLFGGLFIFVCGISSVFSRNNLKRAGLLWLAAFLISLVTLAASYILQTSLFIGWGVIHLMAFSILLYAFIELFFRKIFQKEVPITFCLVVSVLFFFIAIFFWTGFNPINRAYIETWPVKVCLDLPLERLAKEPLSLLFEAVGRYQGNVDWWPIFPYTGVIFLGIAFGKLLYGKQKRSKMPCLNRCVLLKPFCFIGQHTLYIYLAHQPLIIVVLVVVFLIMGFKF